jgi:hypothetical protein
MKLISRDFSKYISNSRAKRIPLTTKRAGKGYYKGNRCRKEGTINSRGSSFIIQQSVTEICTDNIHGVTHRICFYRTFYNE